ncbi:MobC family plasmid mobilization relaxosome protein (plasmid) [Lonepinella koalarum]|uniref:plasmid mobilization protein n=1 Tax=Lonepinella koalarum TaxID=53417 RepID=UPI0011E4C404|nr:plasmid mobilization relaxosome protein MobC [Lonepinella koalarum]TYG33298.1 MobC family plasmid mobilization relaxosome protein [Lonepinella koalarum]
MTNRTREIKIRLTEGEYQALQERKTKARLAEWLRELALDQQPKRHPKPIDPKLLYELNRLGVNLNQIARHCNQQPPSIDLIGIATSLKRLDEMLKDIRETSK